MTTEPPVTLDLVTNPVESAETAGLRYVNDDQPGITRQRVGKGFSYFDQQGRRITDSDQRDYLQSLAIPPAWEEVWICPIRNGHLLATGRDEKGRKQYRYHPQWRKVRSQTKFNRLIPFGYSLPQIRSETDQHLRKRKLSREKVLATVVRLLDTTLIRIGNDYYARKNDSYGLTTLRDRHVEISATKVRFEFQGKRGIEHEIELTDPRLARSVKRCRDIPGYELFQYYDENNQKHKIDSADVNDYLQQITGEEFTAKDFRTWGGTLTAAIRLRDLEFTEEQEAKQQVRQAIEIAAKKLGNKVATCRKYYVHPAIPQAYQEGWLLPTMNSADDQEGLGEAEAGVLAVLQEYFLRNQGDKD
jgi:DNA topoisomerase-1